MHTRIRIPLVGLSTLFALCLASSSHADARFTAETMTSFGNPLDALDVGELLTIDVTLRADGDQPLFGCSAAATGYDPSVLSFVSAQVVPDLLVGVCVPTLGCFGGIDNSTLASSPIIEDLSNPLGPSVTFLSAASTAGTSFTGETDWGYSGVAGDPQFQLVFQKVGPGATSIRIGPDPAYGHSVIGLGGAELPSHSAQISLGLVPEPTTAMLLGLGLAGLASRPIRLRETRRMP